MSDNLKYYEIIKYNIIANVNIIFFSYFLLTNSCFISKYYNSKNFLLN